MLIFHLQFQTMVLRDGQLKVSFYKLFKETHLKSFTQPQEQFNLPSNDFYRYLQISHYITNRKEKEQIGKTPNSIEQNFITILEKHLPLCTHVSHFYKRLSSHPCENAYYIVEKWELESNTMIEDELWDLLCNSCHKGINSQQWTEFNWKLTLRFFHTPLDVSKFVKDPSAVSCWRQWGIIGGHTHIF